MGIEEIQTKFDGASGFELDTDPADESWMRVADVMVSDWSGVALEFAYGFERPVLFVDLPRKSNNPEYMDLGIEPFEVSIREEVGEIVSPDDLSGVPGIVRRMVSTRNDSVDRIQASREQRVFNPGRSATIGADFITNTPSTGNG